MTADTSWYGRQTLVHPELDHQLYEAYGTREAHGDPYLDHYQYGYARQQPPQQTSQHGYAAHGSAVDHGYGGQYGTGRTASGSQQGTTYGWPDYGPMPNDPTLVAEHTGYPGSSIHSPYTVHTPHAAHQGYDAQHGRVVHPNDSTYDTAAVAPFAATTGRPWEEFAAVDPLPTYDDPGGGCSAGSGHEAPEAAVVGRGGRRAESVGAGREARSGGERGRARGSRRRPARRRSAVLTIAVPSVAVLGVAGATAATMGPLRGHHHDTNSASSVAANQAEAQALAASETRDAAERAARDRARTALQLREAAARKTAAEAPRFTLPIAYHSGLSALFGQAGTHWTHLHTGIDFPVPEGTPIHAVTSGTVTTEWNPAYGYMVKLTAPDGTATWYCHLSSYRVRSGRVNVGEIIAYSGDTGNTTGPHLHFEVHPDGGPAVDPLPWLLARGLDPR